MGNCVVPGDLHSLTMFEELVKCSVCFEYMNRPIYQDLQSGKMIGMGTESEGLYCLNLPRKGTCNVVNTKTQDLWHQRLGHPSSKCHNGHTLCSSCKARVLNKCTSCRQQLGDIRCLALEKMTESLQLHCKYDEFGCPEIMHEDSCNFRPYSCPWPGLPCSAVGDIPFLVSHLTDYHKAVMFNGCDFELEFLIEDLRKHSGCRCLIGNQAEACNYSYSLEIGENGRKLTFEGIPRSIRESERRSLESADSLIVLGSMVHSLGGETREPKLEITGGIRKSQIPVCACVDKTG